MFHSAFKQLSEYEITFSSTVNIIETLGGRVGVSETSFRGHGGIARRLTFRPSSMPRPNRALWSSNLERRSCLLDELSSIF
jgi:hypothetical protein